MFGSHAGRNAMRGGDRNWNFTFLRLERQMSELSEKEISYFPPRAESYARGSDLELRGHWAHQFLHTMIGNTAAKDTEVALKIYASDEVRERMVEAAADFASRLERELRVRGWLRTPCTFEEYAAAFRVGQAVGHLDADDDDYVKKLDEAKKMGVVR